MIRIIASDLDGTLLLNGKQELPEELFPMIRRLKDMGILFVAASGRQLSNMRRMFEPVKDDIAYICENGAAALYQGRVLYEDAFDPALVEDVIRTAWKKENTEMSISCLNHYYLRPKTEAYLAMMRDEVRCDYKLLGDTCHVPESCMKMAVYEKDGADAHLKFWQEHFGDRCKVVTSGPAWIDFVPFGTSKGKGIKRIMDILGIQPQEGAAFGDEYNDIELIESVYYGFAMETAKPGVKEKAHFTVQREEEILEKLIAYKGDMGEVLKACMNIVKKVY